MVQNKQNSSYQRRNKTARRTIIGLLLVILFGLGVIYLVKNLTPGPTQSTEPEPDTTTTEQAKTTQSTKPSNIKNQQPTEEDEDPFHKTPTQYEGDDPNLSEELTGSISYTAASGESLSVLVNIDQLLGSGTCTLTLTSSARGTKTYTANIIANPASSSCEGFNVPLTDLGGATSGTWHIHLRFTSGDKTGIVEGDVDLND